MAYHHCAARAIALAGCFASFAALAQAQAPVEAFGNLPLVSAPKLSPDGKHIAMLQPYKAEGLVAIILQTHPEPDAKPVVIGGGDFILANVVWAKNDRLILITKKSFSRPTTTIASEPGLLAIYRGH